MLVALAGTEELPTQAFECFGTASFFTHTDSGGGNGLRTNGLVEGFLWNS